MRTINASQLDKMMQNGQGPLLVNTLPSDKFDATRIEGAINVPQDQDDFAAQVERKAGSKSEPVVVYCASGSCNSSDKAAEKLDNAGFSQVFDFANGAEGWKEHQAAGSS